MRPPYAASLRALTHTIVESLVRPADPTPTIAADEVQDLLYRSLATLNYWYRDALIADAALLRLRLTLAYRACGGAIVVEHGHRYYERAILAWATEQLH